ncbi:Mu-like prophage I protein [Candidatus Hepatincolaceae symbiont of Richtersius coronifer]
MARLINNSIELNFVSRPFNCNEGTISINNIQADLNPISNSDIPTKILILPKSPIMGRDGRKFTYNTSEIIERFIDNNVELPIDFEHESELKANSGQFIPAVGWVKSIEADFEGKIWANVLWNDEAQAIKARHVRYVSPAFTTDKSNKILLLSSLALTNKPNFKLPALNNMQINLQDTSISNNQEAGENMIIENSLDKDIAKALELPEGSSKDAILQKLHDLKQKSNTQ